MLVIATAVLAVSNDPASETVTANATALAIFISLAASYLILVIISKHYWHQQFLPSLGFSPSWLLGSLILGVVFALLIQQLQKQFPAPTGLKTSMQLALSSDDWLKVLVYFSAIGLAPFFEEYLFRGIVFDSFKQQWGLLMAVLLSAFIFTLFHLFEYYHYWLAWLAIFSLAIILAIVRYKSESMLNPIILHAAYNTTLLFHS